MSQIYLSKTSTFTHWHQINQNFRINSEYNYSEGEIYGRPIIKSYIFDEKFLLVIMIGVGGLFCSILSYLNFYLFWRLFQIPFQKYRLDLMGSLISMEYGR